MTIEVYQAEFRCLGDKHEIDAPTTIHDFVYKHAPGYVAGPEQPINAYLNGSLIDPTEWSGARISPADEVHLVLEPKDGGAFLIGTVVAAVVATAAAILLRPSIPNIGGRGSQKGSSIYEVNAQGNQPKLGDVIPEQAGRHKKYPDILCSPVRRYVSKRDQELCLFLSLGKGSFERNINDLKVGSTPITTLPGVSYQFFEPGEYVLGNRAAYNWYSAPEVGASTGASGLRLRGVTVDNAEYTGSSKTEGATLFINSDLPSSWTGDIRLVVNLLQNVTVGSNQTSFFGDFRHLSAGVLVTIQGTILAGIYRVRSVTTGGMLLEDRDNGALLSNFPPGDYNVYMDRTGANYGVVERIEDLRGVVMQRYLADGSTDSTWTEFPEIELTQAVIRPSEATPASLWTGPFLACPENETTATIEWDVFFPNGLGFINDNGEIDARTREVELQWRPLGSSAWNSIIKEVTDSTRDQIGVTFRDNLPSQVTPEIRVRRLTLEDTSTQALDRIEWLGLRCDLPANESYADVSTLALIIQGSDLIASQTENQINIVETRKIPRWDGNQWTAPEPTRDISAWVRYIAHSVGYTDADIDMDELIRLHGLWTSRGETFNHIQDEPTTVKEALNSVLRAGMAELTTDGGRIVPVRDGPRSTPEHMYSPQNYIEGGDLSVSVTTPRHDDPDGIDVEYFDQGSWTNEVVKCRLPGDQGFRAEKVRLEGVTNRLQAWRIGMRERSRQKYARWQYRFSTPTDALNSKYLSYCVAAGEVPGYAQSAIIEAVIQEPDGVHIESSEPLDWNSGVEHVISWRRDDGSYSGAWPAERGDDDYHVIAQIPPGEVPVIQRNMEPPHLLFGEGFHVLVRNIEPDGEQVDVTAENYDERVYAYDDAPLP